MSDKWVQDLYEIGLGEITDAQICDMMDAVQHAIYLDDDGNPTLVDLDATLASIDVDRLNTIFVVGIPRTLFPLRDLLTNWRPLVERAYESLKRRGRPADELLRGLR